MLTKGVRIQLVIFTIIALVATAVAALYYARIPRLLGFGQYTVTAKFSDASGLYPSALVTQSGVDIGLVKSISLTDGAAKVVMSIDNGRRIPSDAHAAIHSTSAIGEQYVDFTADRDGGPFLKSGDSVPTSRTAGLPSSAALLDSVDTLLKSIPNASLGRLLTELDTGFGGTGDDLRGLLNGGDSLVRTAAANIGPTVQLLRIAQPFLTTQLALTDKTTTYVSNLVSFTDQLVASNADIASVLDRTPNFVNQANAFTGELNPTLPTLLADITTVGGVLRTYLPNLQQTIILLPPTVSAILTALSGPTNAKLGTGNLSFKANINDPPPCTEGYLDQDQYQDPQSVKTVPTPPGLFCNVPLDSQKGVRTSHTEPCAGLPGIRAASPELCDQKAGRTSPITVPKSINIPASVADGSSPNAGYTPAKSSSTGSTTASKQQASEAEVPYDPSTGRFQAPDGKFYVLGAGTNPSLKAPKTWQQLLLAPLGR